VDDPVKVIRERASKLISLSSDPDELRKGAELLRTAEEIDRQRAEVEKLHRKKPTKGVLGQVVDLAPWATVFVSVLAMVIQNWSAHLEQKNAIWERTYHAVSNGSAGSAEIAEFVPFLNLKEHREDARSAAERFLSSGPSDADNFRELFEHAFPAVGPENLNDVLRIDQLLLVAENDHSNQVLRANAIDDEVRWITSKVAPVIRNLKPGTEIDLSRVILEDGDLSGADLSKAKLGGFLPIRMNMNDVTLNVDQSSGYIAAKWKDSAWWQARSISANFLVDLEKDASFGNVRYGYGEGVNTNIIEYCAKTSAWNVSDGKKCRGSVPK
jgi:hypothetical protein